MDSYNHLIEKAKNKIDRKQYQEAVSILKPIIENNDRDGYTLLLIGTAYSKLKEYKQALKYLELALKIQQETDNKKLQIYTYIELAFVYIFNGKVKEGFLAQQQFLKLAKELDIPETDPLYSFVDTTSRISDESLEQMESSLQNIKSIPAWDKFGLMGRLMGFATRGKFQSYLFVFLWCLLIIPALVVWLIFSPFWVPSLIYQIYRSKKQKRDNNNP